MPSRKKQKVKTIDQAFEEAVDNFIVAYLEEKKKDFHSQVESFEQHAEKMRHILSEKLEEYRDRFLKGYDVLMQELKKHPKE